MDTVYTYDGSKRLTTVQQFPNGRTNAEDLCQHVTYSYGSNPYDANYSQYITGRLAAIGYQVCSTAGSWAAAEMYSYHPAGAVTAKRLQVSRQTMNEFDNPVTGTGKLDVNYAFTGAGQVGSVTYLMSAWPSQGTTSLQYAYDTLGRPLSLTDSSWDHSLNGTELFQWARNAQYDYAGHLTSWWHSSDPVNTFMAETSSYDALGHLTSIQWSNSNPNYQLAYAPGWSAPAGVSYTYPASGNNGQITQMTDAASGEAVSYTYDVLKRLVSASAVPTAGSSASPWTQNYQYDGFGNLTAKVLNGVTTSIPVNGSTNRLTNASYDANGNMTSGAGATYGYDESNRISYVAPVSGGTESYRYAPDNKRIYKLKADGTEEFTFYGARGEKLGVYQFYNPTSGSGYYPPATDPVRVLSTSIWFGGRLIWDNGAVGLDRLGTNRSAGRFRPYGDPTTSVAADKVGFATYARDGFSGLDYADQRYYASGYGRFNTADPYQASAGPSDPGSWNRYAYVGGDPTNFNDPRGLARDGTYSDNICDPSDPFFIFNDACVNGNLGGGGILSPTAAAAQYFDQFSAVPGFDWDWTGSGLGITISYQGSVVASLSGPYLHQSSNINWGAATGLLQGMTYPNLDINQAQKLVLIAGGVLEAIAQILKGRLYQARVKCQVVDFTDGYDNAIGYQDGWGVGTSQGDAVTAAKRDAGERAALASPLRDIRVRHCKEY